MTIRTLLSTLFIFVVVASLGCDSEEPISVLRPPPGPPEIPDTPDHAVRRFIWAYENKEFAVYRNMLAGNFEYEISSLSDPGLANEFSGGWSAEDERICSQNMFFGGVNRAGQPMPSPSSIELAFQSTAPADDMTDGRDPAVFKSLLTAVRLRVTIGGDSYLVGYGSQPERHRIFLVRGDFAEGLTEDQPADEEHWYVWRWRDESGPVDPAGAPLSKEKADEPVENRPVSWSSVKSLYR